MTPVSQERPGCRFPARRPHPARTRNPLPPVARRKQQGHRPHPRHQPRHRQAARAPYPGQAEPVVAGGSGGFRGGAQGGAGRARRGTVAPFRPVNCPAGNQMAYPTWLRCYRTWQVLLDKVAYMNQQLIIRPRIADMYDNLLFRHVTAI